MQNFFSTIFDFSFSEFVTTKVIKILYGIGIFIAAICALGFIVNGFAAGFWRGLLMLILSPVVFMIYTILARVGLEVIIVIFRISDNIAKIAEK